MKKFWNDYVELCKSSTDFYKKHWFGVLVMNVVTIGGTFVWLYKDDIKDEIEEKFSKKEEEA